MQRAGVVKEVEEAAVRVTVMVALPATGCSRKCAVLFAAVWAARDGVPCDPYRVC